MNLSWILLSLKYVFFFLFLHRQNMILGELVVDRNSCTKLPVLSSDTRTHASTRVYLKRIVAK